MTDQQKHTDRHGDELYLYSDPTGEDVIGVYARQVVAIPAGELLAMIDRAAPDAMRAYLRETVEHTYLENMGVPATERDTISESIASFKGETTEREIPEADSPEGVDERPNVDQARAAGEQLGKIMRAFGDAYAEAMKR